MQQKIKILLKNNNFRNNQNYIFGGEYKYKIIEEKKIDFFYIEFQKYSKVFKFGFIFFIIFLLIFFILFKNMELYFSGLYFIFMIIYLYILIEKTYYVSLGEKYYQEYFVKFKNRNFLKKTFQILKLMFRIIIIIKNSFIYIKRLIYVILGLIKKDFVISFNVILIFFIVLPLPNFLIDSFLLKIITFFLMSLILIPVLFIGIKRVTKIAPKAI